MEDRKKLIVDTAKRLFSEKGYSATGLREIADKAGVSIGNIYNYFRNKEEIFNSIMDPANLIESFPDFDALLNKDFPNNLGEIIRTMKEVIDRNIEEYRLIFIDLIELQGKNTNRVLEALINLASSVYMRKVKDDYVGKSIRPINYEYYNKVFIICTVAYFIISNILPAAKTDQWSDEELSRMLADVLLHGIVVS
jgi:AcrR family transcriptional regulator